MEKDKVYQIVKEVAGDVAMPAWIDRFANAVEDYLRWDGIHSCHPECDKPACVHTRKAVEAERKACAKVAEKFDAITGLKSASAIRLRGENEIS